MDELASEVMPSDGISEDTRVPDGNEPVERTRDDVVDAARTLLSEVDAELGLIEAALGRLEDATYGTCGVCGDAITQEHLAQQPASLRCARHDEETASD